MGKGSTTRRYTDEFKRDAVALYQSSGKTIKEVARQLGVTDTSLGTWIREFGRLDGQTDPETAKEEARLRKRIKELEEEIDILKRFTKFWVGDDRR